MNKIIFSVFCFLLVQSIKSEIDIVDKTIAECDREIFNSVHGAAKSLFSSTGDGQLRCPGGESKSSPLTKKIGRESQVFKCALKKLLNEGQMTKDQIIESLKARQGEECEDKEIVCDIDWKFRFINGECNNLENPRWGSANIAMRRVVAPAYEDGVDEPRGGFVSSLPNPRVISTEIHNDIHIESVQFTNMLPQWGQFLDHDITLTPEPNARCCANPAIDPDCWSIAIPEDDEFYSNLPTGAQTCMDFTRSTPFCYPGTEHREQMNIITAFIDGSHIYGSDVARETALRSLVDGELVGNAKYPGFLPFSEDVDDQIGGITGDFKAGDNRVNEMPGLAVMHQVLHREHNRIARGIKEIMPTWGDERIYQEARRLVGALIQVVTYQEFLPIVLGEASMTQFELKIDSPSTYSSEVDPSIENQFATASYRFGHTLVSGQVYLIDDGTELGSYLVRDNYFNSTEILQSAGAGYKWILGGLTLKESQEFDSHFTEDLTNHLLRNPINLYGSDLAARNIQRGRDHGTPSYNEWRKYCGLQELTSWGAKPVEIETQQWVSLSRVYTQPQDIDLYTGGLIETPISQTVTGPTLNCLLAPQFAKLKFGDRFFATHSNEAGSFTSEEMIELRGRSLGDILCQNSDITEIQENPFLPVGPANSLLSCEDSSRNFDLELFFQFKK